MKFEYYLEKALFMIRDKIKSRNPKEVKINIEKKVKEKLSDMDFDFWNHWITMDKDLTVVMLGDSLSTIRADYSTARIDAEKRPPLMISHAYPTYIEELLRWDGQEYKRFDVKGIFEESYKIVSIKEVDPAWDWYIKGDTEKQQRNRVNRPSITRVLEGANCSISYNFPTEAVRCDFIYRTDFLNAQTTNVSINIGDGYVEVYDNETKTWTEANGYRYSAKEKDQVLTFENGWTYRESIYQKRLKMRKVKDKNQSLIEVKITNDGEGRLTYWGIQHSPREYFIDFLANARGSHHISKIRCYERVDVDVFEPDLILKQNCTTNEGIVIAKEDGTPKDMKGNTPKAMANRFLKYINDLENKPYKPSVINYTLYHSWYTYWLKTKDNTINRCVTNEGEFSGFDYHNIVDSYLYSQGKKVISTWECLEYESNKKSSNERKPIMVSVNKASGKTGSTWHVDGTHPNDEGSKVIFEIMKPFFSREN